MTNVNRQAVNVYFFFACTLCTSHQGYMSRGVVEREHSQYGLFAWNFHYRTYVCGVKSNGSRLFCDSLFWPRPTHRAGTGHINAAVRLICFQRVFFHGCLIHWWSAVIRYLPREKAISSIKWGCSVETRRTCTSADALPWIECSASALLFRETGPGSCSAVGALVCKDVCIAAAIKKINILKSGVLSFGGCRHSTCNVQQLWLL